MLRFPAELRAIVIGNGSSPFPLRIAVACRADLVQAWQQRCIDSLFQDGRAVWAAVIDTTEATAGYPPLPPLFRPAAQRTAPLEVGAHAPVRIAPSSAGSLDCDVVLSFIDADAGAIACKPRLGLWHFLFGREDRSSGEPACFWECYHDDGVVCAALLARMPDGSSSVLRAGAIAVSATSFTRSVDRALDEVARWPSLALATPSASAPFPRGTMSSAAPRANAAAAVSLLARIAWRRIARSFDVLFADKWSVGIARCSIDGFLTACDWPRVAWLAEPADPDYRADPFGAAVDGRTWALVERFDGASARGRIEAFEIADGAWCEPGVVAMTADAHMSFPFLLRDGDSLYCVPEVLGQRAVTLYRALEWPSRFAKAAVLLEAFDAVDTVIVRHGGRWWLFCTDLREPRHHRLHAFYADRLEGPYAAHARNPVKIDPRSAGCAGTPFVVDGVLYRPAQDCSRSYGGRVVINRVVELTPTAFREEEAAIVEPSGAYPAGVHTLSSLGEMTLVDGKRRAFTLRRLLWRLIRRSRRRRDRAE
jgi:hypothetical protein